MQTGLKNHLAWIYTLKIMLVLIIFSISKREGFAYNNITNPQDAISDDLLATFGEQTGHPFSMERVIKAYNSLSDDMRSGINASDIQPTHKYIRFMPCSEDQMWSIEKRSDLNLYPYPLDCESTEGFVGINNPFILNGYPQYWCIVDYQYPLSTLECPYEEESELWFPSDDCLSNPAISSILNTLWSNSHANGQRGEVRGINAYVPSGSVRYVDDSLGHTPLSGMEVQAFDSVDSYSALTNNSGYFSMSGVSFSGDFRYRIKFRRSDFSFHHETNLTSIEFLSDWTHSSLNKFFTGVYAKYSVIFQAAEYFYYSQTELPTPPLNTLWNACLRIRFFPDDSDPEGVSFFYRTGAFYYERPCIDIYGCSPDNNIQQSSQLYAAAMHELGHAMHYGMDRQLFDSIELWVQESVANGVEYFFTLSRYPDCGYYDYFANFSVNYYTAIVRDLCDGMKHVYCIYRYNPGTQTITPHYSAYEDEVNSTYTVPEVIEAVRTCTTPQQWNYRIYQLYHGPGEELSKAFTYWFEYCYSPD